jgi:hypothetical protein
VGEPDKAYNVFMMKIRQFWVFIFGIILCLSLVTLAVSLSFKMSLSNPSKIDQLVGQTSMYNDVINETVKRADNSIGGAQSSKINSPLKRAAEKALPKDQFNQLVDQVVSANYSWLQGKTSKPSYSIDLNQYKNAFSSNVGNFMVNQLSALPACTEAQAIELNTSTNPLTLSCLPSFISVSTAVKQIQSEINSGKVFLNKDVLAPQSLTLNGSSVPYYVKGSHAPSDYKWYSRLPYIAVIIAVLSAVLMWLLSPRKKLAYRGLSYALIASGLLLIAFKLCVHTADSKIINRLDAKASLGTFKPSVNELIRLITNKIGHDGFIFGVVYIVIAILLLLSLGSLKHLHKRQKREARLKPDEDIMSDTESDNSNPISHRFRGTPDIDSMYRTKPSSGSQLGPSTAPRLADKNKKRKPPLIQ